jgi:hypothetical protein
MKTIVRNIGLVLLMILAQISWANAQSVEVEMADQFRADGKIYVVVATLLLVMAGIILFLIWLERRISNLEKELKN